MDAPITLQETGATLLPIINLLREDTSSADKAAFMAAVTDGLKQMPKRLPSRFFYDGIGSSLFQKIMKLPEYYVTRCEHKVLTKNRKEIVNLFSSKGSFHLIDLGAGDALKTKILLRELRDQDIDFEYLPVDISGDAMQQLISTLQKEIPDVSAQAVVGEYFDALSWLHHNKSQQKVILFLGSNIGNFEHEESVTFLTTLKTHLNKGDKLLMGIDLMKDPDTILKAYNDASGITAAFNLNLLHRINRELGGNFKVDQFKHFPLYDPQLGVMKSYIVSKITQEVTIEATGQVVQFKAWEAIHTENSHKYDLHQIELMAKSCGLSIEAVFQDDACGFADILFTVD